MKKEAETIKRRHVELLPVPEGVLSEERQSDKEIVENKEISEHTYVLGSAIRKVAFINCRFSMCTFEAEMKSCSFIRCIFVECRFVGPVVADVRFVQCVLMSNHFAPGLRFVAVRLSSCFGLHRNYDLHTVQVENSGRLQLDIDLRNTPLPSLEKWVSWERLRTFGRLPLFGVSFSALVAIPTVTFLLAAYNEQIGRLQEWAAAHAHDLPAATFQLAQLAARLHPVPLPSLTFWLLISTVLLGSASILYALICPPRIKEFSLEQWSDEFGHPALQYLPLSWGNRLIRAITGVCYVVGGLGSLAILVVKLWNAGLFVVENTKMPWWLW